MGFVNRTANTVSRAIGTDSGTAGTAKAVSGVTSSVGQALSDFDKTVGISAISREATNAAAAIGATVEAIANDPKKLAAVGLMIAFPGAASAVGQFLLPAGASAALGATGTAIIGQTAINIAANGGDVKQGVISALIQQGAPQLTKYVADSYASEGVSKAVTNWAAKATVDAGIATAMGKDPTSALLFSGTKAATNALMESTGINDSLKNLPDSASSAVRAAITAKVMNIDPSKAVAQDLINSAISGARTMYSAQQKAVENNIPPLTEQQLASIPAGTSDAGLRNIVDYQAYAKQKGFEPTDDEIAKLASLTTQQRGGGILGGLSSVTVPNSQALSDFYQGKEAEFSAQQAAIDEQNRLDAEAAAQAQAQADAQAAIDAEVAAQAQAQAQADAQAAIDAETAKATQEAQEAEEQARRVAEFGKDLTGGGNQDLGEVDTDTDFYDKDSTGMGAYKYDPTSGTYTYTSDDGSTLTLDGEGAIVGVTESTDTPWTGITDTKTGNLKLPKLPSGKVPVIPATAVKPTKPPVTPPAEPDPLAAILGQQQTPVTYQTVIPELAKVFYGGQDFSSTPQRLNEQGQLEQQNPLLKEPNFVDPTKPLEKSFAGPQQTLNAQGQLAQRYSLLDEPNFLDPTKPLASSALAPQGNPKENDVAAMLTKIMGGRGNPTSQEELLKILGRA